MFIYVLEHLVRRRLQLKQAPVSTLKVVDEPNKHLLPNASVEG